jgi:hypothetical protein
MEFIMRRSMLTAACAALVLGGTSLPASASASVAECARGNWDFCIETTDDNPGARMWVALTGDKVQICDTDADGKRAVGNVYNGSRSAGTLSKRYTFYAEQRGTCVTKLANMGGVYNLPEGKEFTFEICIDDDPGTDKFCTYYEKFNDNPS